MEITQEFAYTKKKIYTGDGIFFIINISKKNFYIFFYIKTFLI